MKRGPFPGEQHTRMEIGADRLPNVLDTGWTKVKRRSGHTFVLVIVQQALKLGMEDLKMFLNENSLTDSRQLVVSAFMQIHSHAPLLFQQSLFRLTNKCAGKLSRTLLDFKFMFHFVSSFSESSRFLARTGRGDLVMNEHEFFYGDQTCK